MRLDQRDRMLACTLGAILLLIMPHSAYAYAESAYYGQSTYYAQSAYYAQSTYYAQGYYQGTYALKITQPTTITGDANILGAVTKQSGTFVIDHPLDPKNRLLYHSFVESPDVKNIYDGIATLDEHGQATIVLPNYFLALNKDFRYLATPVGISMPDLHLVARVHKRFRLFGNIEITIGGGVPGGKVSWQVTGIRHDIFIQQNPINVVVNKGPGGLIEKGTYLCPECYGVKE